jgi:serine/threonine protein kinase
MGLPARSRLGPYEIHSPLGSGGMGEVYLARDTRLGREVAIKVLPSHLSSSPELKERFHREARAISSLNHPNICTLHDIGEQDGVDFLVMEYLEGETLQQRLRRGPLPLKQVLEYGIQIAEALDRAHQAGIAHRDLKPGNIMLTKSGTKLLDFGLAKPVKAMVGGVGATRPLTPSTPTFSLASMTSQPDPLTREGTIVGTFQYLAPEVLQGKDADARSDIFALGAVLHEMISGKPAFAGKSQLSVITAILENDPERIPQVSVPLEHVVHTCLAKEPAERWQSAREVVRELRWA